MKKNRGLIWPISIAIAIMLVFGFCVGTVVVTTSANIQESDIYMTNYQDADANVNNLIEAEIAFNKKYNISFESKGIKSDGSRLNYKVSGKNAEVIKNAELILAISRPETNEFNKEIKNPTFKNGIYSFNEVKFPKAGIWNLVLKVQVGNDYRFYNVKIDTRTKEAFEF